MKLYFFFFFFIFNSLFLMSCVSQHEEVTYTEAYNLNFNKLPDSTVLYNWIPNVRYAEPYILFMAAADQDSLYTLRYDKQYSKSNRFQSQIEQRILLPVHKEKTASLCFEGKGNNLELVYIAVDGIDHQEKVLFSDTLTFYLKPEFTTQVIDFSPEGIELLDLKIYAEGIEGENAEISFSRMDIFIGDKHLDAYPLRKLWVPSGKTYEIQSLSPNTYEGFDRIEVFKNKKIIGLGESVHNNRCINNLVTDLILCQVKQEVCKLILIESPIERVLLYNNYITHRTFEQDGEFLETSSYSELLKQLKAYNQGKADIDQVRLFGMDYEKSFNVSESSFRATFDYIAAYNQEIKDEVLDKFALLLMEESPDMGKILSYMENHKSRIEKHLSPENYKCIRHILPLSLSVGTNENERNYRRDSIMALNTRFILDSIGQRGSQTILYAHAGHLNPISTYPAVPCVPLGHYLKDWYRDDYASLLVTIGTGNSWAFGMVGVSEEGALASPIEGSVECFLNSFEEDVFYLPTPVDFDKLLLSRFMGSHHFIQQFYPYNLYRRYDGIFFIKDCMSAEDIPLTLQDKMMRSQQNPNPDPEESDLLMKEWGELVEKGRMKEINRMERREQLLKEIKERIQK